MFDKIIPLWLKDKKQKTIWFIISSLMIGTVLFLPPSNILIQAIGQLATPILVKIIISLLLVGIGLLLSLILHYKKNKAKPDFSKYIHSVDDQCWINLNNPDDRICSTCKLEDILSQLHRSNNRWRCPKQEHGHFGELRPCGVSSVKDPAEKTQRNEIRNWKNKGRPFWQLHQPELGYARFDFGRCFVPLPGYASRYLLRVEYLINVWCSCCLLIEKSKIGDGKARDILEGLL